MYCGSSSLPLQYYNLPDRSHHVHNANSISNFLRVSHFGDRSLRDKKQGDRNRDACRSDRLTGAIDPQTIPRGRGVGAGQRVTPRHNLARVARVFADDKLAFVRIRRFGMTGQSSVFNRIISTDTPTSCQQFSSLRRRQYDDAVLAHFGRCFIRACTRVYELDVFTPAGYTCDYLRISDTARYRVSARTTTSAGDCTRPSHPWLFVQADANGYLRTYRCRYNRGYIQSESNYHFPRRIFSFSKSKVLHAQGVPFK